MLTFHYFVGMNVICFLQNVLSGVSVDSSLFFSIKFGQKTNEEKETEQFDGEVYMTLHELKMTLA